MTKTDTHKKAMIEALRASLGIVSEAADACGISRQQHYQWVKDDSVYKEQVDAIGDMAIDFAETALKKKISDGDTTAIIFYLKTKGKRRGFVERSEIDQIGAPPSINIHVTDARIGAELKKLLE
jgi:hypothetical protein